MKSNTLILSIIICTYNREKFLEKCLDSLLVQTVGINEVETIVVDNNSSDGTRALMDEYLEKYSQLKYIFEKEQGLSCARNRGCREASGEYLAYLDDDAMASPKYLESVLSVISEHHPDILGGPIYPYYLTSKPKWFKDEYEIRKHSNKTGFNASCRASGGNFIIRKELLIDLGLFDTNLGMIGNEIRLGEERAVIESYKKIIPEKKRKGYYSMECFITHYVPPEKMKRSYLFKRYYQAGRGIIKLNNKNPQVVFRVLFLELVPEIIPDIRKQRKENPNGKLDFTMLFALFLLRWGKVIQMFKAGPRRFFFPHFKNFSKNTQYRVKTAKKKLEKTVFKSKKKIRKALTNASLKYAKKRSKRRQKKNLP